MPPSQKLTACMAALGCELSDLAYILGTRVTRLRRIFRDEADDMSKYEDFMLHRLCGGMPSETFMSGIVAAPKLYDVPTSERDPILLQQLDIVGKAYSIAWRISRLCKEDERFSEGDIVVSVLSVYGSKGSCTVQVLSPKYLPGTLVNIVLKEAAPAIAMSCVSGFKCSIHSTYNWAKMTATTIRQAAGRAKSFLTTMLNRSVWKKRKKNQTTTT